MTEKATVIIAQNVIVGKGVSGPAEAALSVTDIVGNEYQIAISQHHMETVFESLRSLLNKD